eukprot:1139839-Pelagomonas_calceolata.AAC.2
MHHPLAKPEQAMFMTHIITSSSSSSIMWLSWYAAARAAHPPHVALSHTHTHIYTQSVVCVRAPTRRVCAGHVDGLQQQQCYVAAMHAAAALVGSAAQRPHASGAALGPAPAAAVAAVAGLACPV